MFKQKMLKVAPLVAVCGLILGGCANQQAWSPALEDAQNTYAQISQDPVVASLAAAELQAARQQLITAETAADEFRKPHTINHEAKLAKIKTLVAQQRARALSANHSLQLAMGQPTLLPEELVLAATIVENFEEPIMQAAHSDISGQQDIASQIAALSQQLAALQAQVGQPQTAQPQTAQPQTAQPRAAQPQAVQPQLADIPARQQTFAEMEMIGLHANDANDEPVLAAAMAAPSMEMQNPQPSVSTEQLKQQLNAINAKPASQGMSLTLGDRYFDQGTARLWNGRAARHLDNVTAVLSNNPELILDIEAHTDNVIDPDVNYDLSMDRAVSIKSALVLRGIDKSRINARGFGHTRPIADNESPLGRLQNRRVELIFPNIQL